MNQHSIKVKPTETEATALDCAEAKPARRVFLPRTSGRRSEAGVTLTVELPGVAPEALEVAVEGRVLSLRAVPRGAASNARPLRTEFGDVEFRRDFELTPDLDTERIEAQLRHGLLSLEIPSVRPERRAIVVG